MSAKTLVIRHGALGDLAKVAPFLNGLQSIQPITLLTDPIYADLILSLGLASEVIPDSRKKLRLHPSFLKESLYLQKKINAFDEVIDLQSSSRTKLYAKLAPSPIWKHIDKKKNNRRVFLTQSNGTEEFPYLNGTARTEQEACYKNLKTKIRYPDFLKIAHSFNTKAPYIVLILDVSPNHPEKSWPLERFVELASLFSKQGHQIVCCAHKSFNMGAIDPNIFDLSGKTSLPQLMEVLSHASLVIGADTGSLHWASLFQRPTISLFSDKSDPRKHAPVSKTSSVIHAAGMAEISAKEVFKTSLTMKR